MKSKETEQKIIILNYIEGLQEEYKIRTQQEITNDNIEFISNIEDNGKIITSTKIRDDYIILTSVKIKNQIEYENPNIKDIALTGFSITIIKPSLKNNNKDKQEICINIPVKGEKIISKKNFFNLNFFFYDYIKVDEIKNYLIIYIFEQLHIFKIYEKNDTLKYNKIKVKNFTNQSKITVMYLGANILKKENILEIGLLLKPVNSFLFLPIDISDKNIKLEEKEYTIDKEKYKNILTKFKRSYCGKYIFTDKETNQKYLLYKDENNNEMIVKELEINHIWNNNSNKKEFFYLYNVEYKNYIIAEIPPKNDEQNISNYLSLGIFNVIYNKENDIYNIQLNQEIKIKNESGIKDYNIGINSSNCISINIEEILYLINLDKNGCVDSVNNFQLNSKNLGIIRKYYEKYQEWSILAFYINEKIYFSKFSDEFNKIGKCLKKYEQKNENINKDEEDKNIIINKNEENEDEYEEEKEEKEKSKIIEKINKKKNKNKIKQNEEEMEEDEDMQDEMKQLVEKIINDKMEIYKKKIEKLKKEKDKKFKMIKEDIQLQYKENEILEKKCNDIIKRIQKLNKIKNNNEENEDEEDEEEKEDKRNNNFNKKHYTKKYNNNNNINYNQIQNQSKINIRNNPTNNNYIALGQQQLMMNQFNLQNPNMLYLNNNNQLNLNDPRVIQFLQQQQQNLINQKIFLQNNINKNNYH